MSRPEKRKPHHGKPKKSTTKSALTKTKSESGRGTQAPGSKLLYNGT